ncbi:MAG: DUF447 family protein [Aigarchaeota archaeon]|nr:DUF447 family protein [Aigarchaeota archaeon]MDW8092401.1 DUF447 family protein [Nitrososphaerota archaeon]
MKETITFIEGMVYECVVTTFSEDRAPHSASMGVRFYSRATEDIAIIRPHVESQTYRNLVTRKSGAINVVDPLMLVECALDLEILEKEYRSARSVDAPLLEGAQAWIEFTASNLITEGEWSVVECALKEVRAGNRQLQLFSRATSALVEAAVAASRVQVYRKMNDQDGLRELMKTIERSISLARRLGKGTLVERVADELIKRYLV